VFCLQELVQSIRFEVSWDCFRASISPEKLFINFSLVFRVLDHESGCAAHFADILFQAFESATPFKPQETLVYSEYYLFMTRLIVVASEPTQLAHPPLYAKLGPIFLSFQVGVLAVRLTPFSQLSRVASFSLIVRLPALILLVGFVFTLQFLVALWFQV